MKFIIGDQILRIKFVTLNVSNWNHVVNKMMLEQHQILYTYMWIKVWYACLNNDAHLIILPSGSILEPLKGQKTSSVW